MNISTQLAEALRTLLTVPNADSAFKARAALKAWQESRYAPEFPTDFARDSLARYDADIAAENVEYAYFSGLFSEIVRGMVR